MKFSPRDIRILTVLAVMCFSPQIRADDLVRRVPVRTAKETPSSVTANAQAIQWMKTGVWTARLSNRQVVPDSIRRLGPKGTFYQPMMHPEGTSVVFWGTEDGTKGSDIWLSGIDGSPCRRLTSDGQSEGPSWSPDGEAIFYSSGKDSSRPHIWRMDADGGNQRQLTDGPWGDSRPCVSPDGKTLVFVSNRSGSANLWRMATSGSEPVPVTRHEGIDFKPCFSPDGRFLAYHTGNGKGSPHNLAIMRWPDGKATLPVQLKSGEWLHGPFWTTDGSHVLVHGYLMGVSLTRLYLVNVHSGQVQLFPVPGFTRWGHGSWDRAETIMAFDGERS